MSRTQVAATACLVKRRARAALPESVAERARLQVARRLETRLRNGRAVRGAAIVLHAVGPRDGDADRALNPPLATCRLDAAVRYLADRYILVRAADLPSAARSRGRREPVPVAVTFDDDLPSHREHALPVLRRHDGVATAFLCGAGGAFWWQLLQTAIDGRAIQATELPGVHANVVEPALDGRPGAIAELAKVIEDLRPVQRDAIHSVLARAVPSSPGVLEAGDAVALADAGWELGFHTRRHDVLTRLDDTELAEAVRRVPDATGSLPRTLAYPHGKATPREAAAADDAGYVAAYTGSSEVLTEATDVHLIGRLQPDMTTVGRFALALARALNVS